MKKLLFILAAFLAAGSANAQCSASFSTTFAPSGNSVLNYNFVNTSTATTTGSYHRVSAMMDYGDGTWGQFYGNSSLVHNYAAPGVYGISLALSVYDSLTNTVICVDTSRTNLTVAYGTCPFRISNVKLNDSTYTFTATNPASTSGLSYSWNFGDGTTATGASVTHTYARGYYGVTATATGSGCTYTNSMWLTVSWLGAFHCDSAHTYLNHFVQGRTASMSAVISLNGNYNGMSYHTTFDYGDGTAVTANSSHIYTATGSYTVSAYYVLVDSNTSAVLCRDTLTNNVQITQQYSDLTGYVNWDSVSTSITGIKVYLIKYDGAAGTLSAVDSVNIVGGGIFWRTFVFRNVPADTYLVKAAVVGQSVGNNGLVPTYADSSLLWSGARQFIHDGNNNTSNVFVNMRQGTVTSGPGFVAGSVTLGANKGSANGAPGVSIILRNANGGLVAMTETDAQGNYSFSNIPVGTYTVLPELLNYDAMASATFSISAANPNVSGMIFIKDDSKMSIRSSSLGIADSRISALSVSPNPAHSFVRISGDRLSRTATPVEVRDLSGKTVLRSQIEAGSSLNLDISQIPAGMYFVYPGGGTPAKLIVR